MAKQHLTEVSDKAKANEAYRVSSPDSAQSFQRGVQPISQLQRTLGNRDVARLIQAKRLSPSGEIIGLQRKLTVGAADDQYEQEADQVAHQVMNIPDSAVANSMQRVTSPEDDQEKMLQTKPLAASITPFVQREIVSDEEDKETPVQAKLASVQREISPEEDKDKPVQARFATEISKKSLQRQPEAVEEEEEPIQAKSAGSMSGGFEAGDDVESQISQSKGLGSPLPDPVRSYMEPRFGVDFSGVRVHTGNDAVQMNRDIGAQAFTHGSDVYFGEGRSPNNLELTAHELTHVVQQTGGGIRSKPIKSDHIDCLRQTNEKRENGMVGPKAQSYLIRREENDGEEIDYRVGEIEGLRNILHNALNIPVAGYQSKIEETRATYGFVLAGIARNYEHAWCRHNQILRSARVAAEEENIIRGVVIGAAASVVASAVAAAIPAVAALETFSAGWWVSTGVQAGVSSAVGTGFTSAISAPTNFETQVPESLGEIRQLQQLLSFERSISRVHRGASNVGRKLSMVDAVLDELSAGNVSASASRDADDIIRHSSDIENLPSRYFRAYQAMLTFKQSLESWEAPSRLRFEQMIWVHWIGSLSLSDHDLLDRDEIEDYLHRSNIGVLGENGILGVDTRELFDTDKEEAAIEAARNDSVRMESELSGPSVPRR